MTDLVLIALGPLGTLQLTREQYEAALIPPAVSMATAPPGSEPWLDSRQLAQLTGIGDTTLEQWAAQGKVPSIRAGKALRFKLSEVEAALRSRPTDSRSLTVRQAADRAREKTGNSRIAANGSKCLSAAANPPPGDH